MDLPFTTLFETAVEIYKNQGNRAKAGEIYEKPGYTKKGIMPANSAKMYSTWS